MFSEDLVEERGFKTNEELATSMRLKDTFREHALADIMDLLQGLYINTSLRLLILSVLSTYTEWIPIELSLQFLNAVIECVT